MDNATITLQARDAIIRATARDYNTKRGIYSKLRRDSRAGGETGLECLFKGLLEFYKFHGGRTKTHLTAAIGLYQKALSLNVPRYLVRTELGYAYSGLDDTDNAVRQLRLAMRSDPTYPRAPAILGHIKMRMGDLNGAISLLDKSLKCHPDFLCALFGVVLLLRIEGRFAEALHTCDQGLRLHPKNKYMLIGSGLVHLSMGSYGKSRKSLLGAIAVDKAEFMPLWGLTYLESASGKHSQARHYMRRLVGVEGNSPFVKATRAVLKRNEADVNGAEQIVRELRHKCGTSCQLSTALSFLSSEGL